RWFGPAHGVAARRCARCGHRLRREIDGASGVVERVELHCSECAATMLAPVKWSFGTGDLPYEPSFGMALALQEPCRGQILWAYNPRHLAFLRDFVAATQRERAVNHNGTLASRLPRWIKLAKNREAVLGAVAELEARMIR